MNILMYNERIHLKKKNISVTKVEIPKPVIG